MARLAKKPKNKSYNRNPTGKGGFKDHPQNINLAGAPVRGESLGETLSKLWNLTRDEAADYFGRNTPIGMQIMLQPANVPLKDVMSIRQIITLCNDSDGRLFGTIGDRAEGKPAASLELTGANGKDLLPEQMKPSEIAERVAALLKEKNVDGN